MLENNFLSVAQFQRLVGDSLRRNPALQSVWILAELSDVRVSGGHCYMELVEKNESGATVAKMRATIWRSSYGPLYHKFVSATGSEFRSGIKLLVKGSVSYHELYGMNFVVSDIDPSYTVGDMERIRREILARLAKEGIASRNRSLTPPPVPRRIAVISASGAAGYGDFMNQILANPQGFRIYPQLFEAVMQGDRTVTTVLHALDWVEQTAGMWDCVVIIRGGGATTDLNYFDNYELARRICLFPLPVVVGIGHERDRTVLDELACVRCKTPTAVAAWILGQLDNAWARACDDVNRIARYTAEALKGEHLRLAQAETGLPAIVARRTMRADMDLQQRMALIERALKGKTATAQTSLQLLANRLATAARNTITNARAKVDRLDALQRVLSPQNTLRRGYSITRLNGHAVADISALKQGDTLTTTLLDGEVTSSVTLLTKND